MTWGFELTRRWRWFHAASPLFLFGLLLVALALRADPTDCTPEARGLRTSDENPVCIGPLTPAGQWAVGGVGALLLAASAWMGAAWWRASRAAT